MEPVVGNAKPVWKVFVTAENLEKALTRGRFLVVLTKMEILSCLPRVWTSNRPDAFASMETQTPKRLEQAGPVALARANLVRFDTSACSVLKQT